MNHHLHLLEPTSVDTDGISCPFYNSQLSLIDSFCVQSLNLKSGNSSTGAISSPEVKHLEFNTLAKFKLPAPGGAICPGSSTVSEKLLSPQLQEAKTDMKQNETTRSSGDYHIPSTSSTDTLVSEYPISDPNRLQWKKSPGHHPSLLNSPQPTTLTEMLMMGYAQITGSFTIDGSLIKQQPFEHVKRKCIVGGQSGGGIIRAENREHQNGLFNNLRWANLGDSITEILGGGELDSMKYSKESAGLRSIPILSTPQSVLFVDLKVGPGQSITYTYRCPLPNALPPTHRGRAMKVNYHLTIGIQRAANAALKHQISTVDVPFWVTTGTAGETCSGRCEQELTRGRKEQAFVP